MRAAISIGYLALICGGVLLIVPALIMLLPV